MNHRFRSLPLLCLLGAGSGFSSAVAAQPITHTDESRVPQYTLPEVLTSADGHHVTDAHTWTDKRRREVLELFAVHEYGRSPGRPENMRFVVRETAKDALGGKATRKQISVLLRGEENGPRMEILLYTPNTATGPVPAFLGLNFSGNHSIHSDPGIFLSDRWMRPGGNSGIQNNRATEETRGSSSSRWPVETILDRGYGLATVYYGDLEPDFADGWKTGIRGIALKEQGRTDFEPDAWGGIAAWAWGLSRALDYLQNDPQIDPARVAVLGHSRLGKTALWAGAQDERFALVISNDSGCGGAALNRRGYGETVERINTSFPHWFCSNFKKYNKNESGLPMDQHMLIALMAPRPVYVASALEDQWADPKGEFLSAKHAGPVYQLFGLRGVESSEQPAVNSPVGDSIGYHIRTGKHDVTDYDWHQYLNFADRHLGKPGK